MWILTTIDKIMKNTILLFSVLSVLVLPSPVKSHSSIYCPETKLEAWQYCPESSPTDIVYIWAILTNDHHQTVSLRYQLGLRTYSYDEIKGGFPSEGNVPVQMAQILRKHGIEVVNKPDICASITDAIKNVKFTRDTGGMIYIYAKIDDYYYVMLRRGSNRSFVTPPIIKLDSMFNVIVIAEL